MQCSRTAVHRLFILKGHIFGSCPGRVTVMPGADAETYLPTAGERVCMGQCGVFAFCNRCPVCGAQTESTLQGTTVLCQIQLSERGAEIWGLLNGGVTVEDISRCRFI